MAHTRARKRARERLANIRDPELRAAYERGQAPPVEWCRKHWLSKYGIQPSDFMLTRLREHGVWLSAAGVYCERAIFFYQRDIEEHMPELIAIANRRKARRALLATPRPASVLWLEWHKRKRHLRKVVAREQQPTCTKRRFAAYVWQRGTTFRIQPIGTYAAFRLPENTQGLVIVFDD